MGKEKKEVRREKFHDIKGLMILSNLKYFSDVFDVSKGSRYLLDKSDIEECPKPYKLCVLISHVVPLHLRKTTRSSIWK